MQRNGGKRQCAEQNDAQPGEDSDQLAYQPALPSCDSSHVEFRWRDYPSFFRIDNLLLAAENPLTMPTRDLLLARWALDIIELILVLGVMIMMFRPRRTRTAPSVFTTAERRFREFARRKTRSVVAVAILCVGVRVALAPVLGIPEPGAHDEFSYLLAADTFAHGHLTNPPHPLWIHFESFHIIQHPTYMSMYPPAHGLVLAAGQLLGHAWIGQLLITALMCAALCWMLQEWVPAEWALLGGVLAVLRMGVFGYWMNGYWCASVTALGGALVLGAWPRVKRRARIEDALWMALGLVILANSRPYEGFVLALPVGAAMMVWMISLPRNLRPAVLGRVAAPILVVLLIAAALMGYYNDRVNGSPLRMGYEVNRNQYSSAAYFIWQGPRPEPVYHHEVMRKFYEKEFEFYEQNRTLAGFLSHAAVKISWFWRFFLGPALTIPLFSLPWIFRDRRLRLALLVAAVFVLGLAIETWFRPHYFAPATALLYLIVIQCMRHLRCWRGKTGAGAALVRAVPLVCCGMVILRIAALLVHAQIEPVYPRGNLERARIVRELEQVPGQHVVLVHYAQDHIPDNEWVYNAANIDGAKVVWAREMDRKQNQELLDYFPGRQVWLVEPDHSPPVLSKWFPATAR